MDPLASDGLFVNGEHFLDRCNILGTNSGLEIAAAWIKRTLGRLFGKKAILLILVKVYRKIYPGNRIQQIILLKIEKTS